MMLDIEKLLSNNFLPNEVKKDLYKNYFKLLRLICDIIPEEQKKHASKILHGKECLRFKSKSDFNILISKVDEMTCKNDKVLLERLN